MENNSFVEFKKERDLGAIISDTFKFIRENWKEYFTTIIKIAGPFIIIGVVIMAFFFISFSGVFLDLENGGGSSNISSVFGSVGLLIIIGIAVYILVSATSLYFIKSYIDNNGIVNYNEVRTNTFSKIWSFLGLGMLIGLMVLVGIVLCYIPGIYLGVVFSLATSIMVFENKSIGDTISHSFTLIKDQWWSTFGVFIVVTFLVSILGTVFSVPAIIYQFIKMATISDDPSAMSGLFSDPVYIGLNVLSYIGKFILSSITLIATVFIYYDLNEQKNLTGTIERIDKLGS